MASSSVSISLAPNTTFSSSLKRSQLEWTPFKQCTVHPPCIVQAKPACATHPQKHSLFCRNSVCFNSVASLSSPVQKKSLTRENSMQTIGGKSSNRTLLRGKNFLHVSNLDLQCRASAVESALSEAPPLPRTAEEQVTLAREALQRAETDGVKRQRMQLLLPIDSRASNFLDTEPRDYPCSMKEEFEVAVKVATKILQSRGDVRFRKIGEKDQEMDPVGLVSTADKRTAAVVYPIAETLKQIQELAANSSDATLVLVNAQWNNSGQIVSDFGFGPWKRKAEEFLDAFRPTFELFEQRVGEASNITSTQGGVVRLLRAYPHDWQVYLMSSDGNNECIGTCKERPSYSELAKLLEEVRKTRPAVLSAMSTSAPPPPPLARSVAGPFTDEEIDEMDKSELRRALTALNLPTSGRITVLQQRVKDAQRQFGLVN